MWSDCEEMVDGLDRVRSNRFNRDSDVSIESDCINISGVCAGVEEESWGRFAEMIFVRLECTSDCVTRTVTPTAPRVIKRIIVGGDVEHRIHGRTKPEKEGIVFIRNDEGAAIVGEGKEGTSGIDELGEAGSVDETGVIAGEDEEVRESGVACLGGCADERLYKNSRWQVIDGEGYAGTSEGVVISEGNRIEEEKHRCAYSAR